MDFLNKAYAQIAELFKSMTPGARLTAGLLFVVIVVSLGYLFNSKISGPTSDLLHGVPATGTQIQAMMAAFGKANLNDAVPQGTQIFVPHGQEAKYMGALADAKALPPNFGTSLVNAVNSNNFATAPEDRANRMVIAKQEEMGLILSSMPGIERAYVLFDSSLTGGFGKREKIATALAVVQPKGSQELDEDKVSSIRQAVVAGFAGLKPENVTVSDQNGHTWAGSSDGGGNAGNNKYVATQKTYEKFLKDNIRNSLSYIPGVTVATYVKLDKTETTRTTEIKHEKPVEVHTSESNTERTADSAGNGGQAGFARQQPNQGMSLANTASGGSKEEEKGSKSESTLVPNDTQTDTVKAGMLPQLATAAIGIPSGYFKKAWLAENPPPAGQEPKDPDKATLDQFRTKTIADIKKQVSKLLPQPEGNAEALDSVEVTAFPEIPVVMPPEPSLAKNALLWLGDSWSVVGMFILAGISLLMLRSMVKSTPPMPQSGKLQLADTPEVAASDPNKPPRRVRRFSAGPSLRDEISALVKEDPDTAANILKTWIGHAS